MVKSTKYPVGFDDYLRDHVEYCPKSGNLFWKVQSWKNIRKMGRPIGSVHIGKYLAFRMKFNGQDFYILNHRAAFFLHHGYWPIGVDHKDGDGFNNRESNLREACQMRNNGNKSAKHGRKYKGIYFRKDRGTWSAQITINKKSVKLGTYTCEEEAALAYNYAALDYFGTFSKLNEVFEDHPDALTESKMLHYNTN